MRKLCVLSICTMCLLVTNLNGRTTAALPTIDIVSFTIERYSDGVNLIWKVMHDGQVELYFLQHSRDQLSWETIAEIEPAFGEEFDTQDFFHGNLQNGTHYYRLVARLATGGEETSKALIYHLDYDTVGGVSAGSPSVVNFGSTLSLTSDDPDLDVHFEIRDAEGNVVFVPATSFEIDLNHLKPGVYYVYERISGDVQKVIKL